MVVGGGHTGFTVQSGATGVPFHAASRPVPQAEASLQPGPATYYPGRPTTLLGTNLSFPPVNAIGIASHQQPLRCHPCSCYPRLHVRFLWRICEADGAVQIYGMGASNLPAADRSCVFWQAITRPRRTGAPRVAAPAALPPGRRPRSRASSLESPSRRPPQLPTRWAARSGL